jgi:hypothetical protein
LVPDSEGELSADMEKEGWRWAFSNGEGPLFVAFEPGLDESVCSSSVWELVRRKRFRIVLALFMAGREAVVDLAGDDAGSWFMPCLGDGGGDASVLIIRGLGRLCECVSSL